MVGVCGDENLLVRFVEGSLDEDEALAVENHLDRCADCLHVVAEVARGLALATTGDDARATAERPWLTRGDVVGRYVVLEWLGSGGMGQVYAADDPDLGRRIALKLVGGIGAPALEERLLREARAMAQLSHPNVVAIHDVGVIGDRAFIAMELVRGTTLRRWCRESPRSWQEILAAFAAAGRGLSAAHRAGIVHRDFKPGNVLRGEDGRIQVTDFGLARGVAVDTDPSAPDPPADLLASHGSALVGTPAYMAPEQLRGEAADARTDQFGFCVALYEALFERHPFGEDGQPPTTLVASLVAGRLQPMPPGKVPAPVRRAIARGLSADRALRFATMDDLLAELALAPARRRRRALAGIATAAAIALLAVLWLGARRSRSAPRCRDGADQVAAVWTAERRAAIAARFRATALAYAEAAWQHTARVLDHYASAWADTRDAACSATRLSGSQSDHVLDLRMACLGRRLDELDELLTVLADADPDLVEHATDVTRSLYGLDGCDAARLLAGDAARPENPAARAEIEALDRALTRARALHAAGKYDQVVPMLEALVDRAHALGFLPLEVAILDQLVATRVDATLPHELLARTTLLRARAAGDSHYEARTAINLAGGNATDASKRAQADFWADYADAVLTSIGGDPQIEAELAEIRGAIALAAGEPAGAIEHYEDAISKWQLVPDPPPTAIAEALTYLGTARHDSGDFEGAVAAHQRSLELLEAELGPNHPRLLSTLNNLAVVYHRLGRIDDALAIQERSLALRELSFGPDSARVANALVNLALTLRTRHRFEDAQDQLERAVAIYRRTNGPDDRATAVARLNLANVLRDRNQPAAAEAEARAALATLEQRVGPDHPDLASGVLILAAVLSDLERYPESIANFRRALAIQERALGPDHPDLAYTLVSWAETCLLMAEPGKALPLLERALALQQPGDDSLLTAEIRFVLARALVASRGPRTRARAVALAEQARARYAAAKVDERVTTIDRWLADRGAEQ